MRNVLRGRLGAAVVVVLALGSVTQAKITIETVPVGNPGNAGQLSGNNAYDSGPERVCGKVNYAYNIGKYEVTAGQYTAFLNAVAATDTYELYYEQMSQTDYGCGITRSGSSGSYTYNVDPAFVNRPVNHVSFGDAMRFANWLHNGQPTGAQNSFTTEDGAYCVNGAITAPALHAVTRKAGWEWAVTSEDEWYKAAYYNPASSSYNLYPTSSSSTAPGRDLSDVSGNNANTIYVGDTDPYPIQSPYYFTLAGEFQSSESPYNTFDQGGNVWEWNEAIIFDPYDQYLRGMSGGSYTSGEYDLRATSRNSSSVWTQLDIIGFRVSQVPEPTSLALLALGGVGLLIRRRGARG